MQHHVFLSYSRKDADLMHRVCDDLRAAGLSVWTDEALTPGTEAWRKAIESAIEESGCVAVLLSPSAKQSLWINRELAYARSRKPPRRVFPILAKGDEDDAIPIELIDTQRVDIRGESYIDGIKQLTITLCNQFGIATPSEKSLSLTPISNAKIPAKQQLPRTQVEKPKPDFVGLPYMKALQKRQLWDASGIELTSSVKASIIVPRPLKAWSLYDQFLLFWWSFVRPEQLITYREALDKDVEKRVGIWLASSLSWLPFFIAILGISRNPIPGFRPVPFGIDYSVWIGVIVVIWLLTSRLSYRDDFLSLGVSFGILSTVVLVGIFGTTSVIALVVLLGVLFGTVWGVVVGVAFGIAVLALLGALFRACYALQRQKASVWIKRCSIIIAKARKCSPLKVSGKRS